MMFMIKDSKAQTWTGCCAAALVAAEWQDVNCQLRTIWLD